ncbi:MAG: hypothetical protein NVV82_00995 [Sporocytophaga sp.]|nr:hypothetical protein [Sporocytophaga sp.]
MSVIRKYCLAIMLFFVASIIADEVYAQFGTSRRVARRTSRRTSRRVNRRYNEGTVAALPPGCAAGADCNGTRYEAYYDGTGVVYQPY